MAYIEVIVDWISCKLVTSDETLLNVAARARFRETIIRLEICPNPMILDHFSSFVNGIDGKSIDWK